MEAVCLLPQSFEAKQLAFIAFNNHANYLALRRWVDIFRPSVFFFPLARRMDCVAEAECPLALLARDDASTLGFFAIFFATPNGYKMMKMLEAESL